MISFNKNNLLYFMLLSYSITIFYIYLNYCCNSSVSNIICNKNCRSIILFFISIMGFFTILYEKKRKNIISLILISLLLIGIYGVICINETKYIHYLFAAIAFFSIILFMIHHSYLTKSNVLFKLLYIQLILFIITIINLKGRIFFSEVAYILNFAIFYLYLHIKY